MFEPIHFLPHGLEVACVVIFWFSLVAAPVIWFVQRKNRKTCKRP